MSGPRIELLRTNLGWNREARGTRVQYTLKTYLVKCIFTLSFALLFGVCRLRRV